jgi:UDP-N-acetylmuramoyl-L-alanyl-D-glutamate--2,6-diaminopimelate ligase
VQVQNLLCSMSLILSQGGHSVDEIIKCIPKLRMPPGRFECVVVHNQSSIYVDYAHTPNALEELLKNMRVELLRKCLDLGINQGRLIIVFGCGGDRDKTKRPVMGEIASSFADLIVVTDDNPRFENPEEIRCNVVSGCSKEKTKEVAGRRNAIHYAVQILRPGDLLVVAGKGHEEYQVIGGELNFFSDKDEIKRAVEDNSVL